MSIRCVIVLLLVVGITAFPFFPSPFRRSATVLKDTPDPQFSPFGEFVDINSNEDFADVVKEKTDHIEVSGLLLSDASDWGIKTALAEEHIAMGNFEEAVKLAREAMAIADHVRQPDSVYHLCLPKSCLQWQLPLF